MFLLLLLLHFSVKIRNMTLAWKPQCHGQLYFHFPPNILRLDINYGFSFGDYIWNTNTRNTLTLCSFGTYSVLGMNRIALITFILLPQERLRYLILSSLPTAQNEQKGFTLNMQNAEYGLHCESLGTKSRCYLLGLSPRVCRFQISVLVPQDYPVFTICIHQKTYLFVFPYSQTGAGLNRIVQKE